jgi:hypothetical protein
MPISNALAVNELTVHLQQVLLAQLDPFMREHSLVDISAFHRP